MVYCCWHDFRAREASMITSIVKAASADLFGRL
jgi:hypothetical protein